MRTSTTAMSLALFVLAGLCEISGGYPMWKWWREAVGVAVIMYSPR